MPAPQTLSEYRLAIDDLDRAILTLAGRINAATYELLVLVREFDERAGWLKWGFDNCAQWLHWRCDLSLNTAREKVRVAHALKDLPQISAACESGKLSYSKVRALTRVATPSNESSLCDFAMTVTATTVEERCRQLRNVQPASADEANRIHARRSLSIFRNIGRGTMTISVELPIEQGELVAQAIDKAAEQDVATGPEGASESWHAQQADALVSIAMNHLNGAGSGGGCADNYQVLIHVDESALTRGEGRSDLPIDAVKRLTCDGSVVGLVENADGEPLRLGRKQRTVNVALRRALHARDRGCRFPGCTHTRYIQAHHVKHWIDGGETDLDSLVSLCPRHHRLFHEGGYTIGTDAEGRWYFRRPDGRVIPAFGYRPEDMIDDDVDASAEGAFEYQDASGASAEGRMFHAGKCVRESAASYYH